MIIYRTQNRNKFFDILDRYSISYGKEKGTSSDEDVPLCGWVTDLRTFYEDYLKCIEFCEWLKEKVERARLDMTQQDLADALEVSRQTINAIEKGKFNPSTILALKISSIFQKGVNEIFTLEESD